MEKTVVKSLQKGYGRIWKAVISAFFLAMLCGSITTFAAGGVSAKLNSLKSKFPDQSFWNHRVTAVSNNADNLVRNWDESYAESFTYEPCYTHSSEAPVGVIDCNYFDGGVQCEGYARKIFYDVFGQRISGLLGSARYDKSNIMAGDYVHFNYPHAGVVLSRSGDTIYLAECNFKGYNCWIRWGNYTSYNVYDVEFFIHAPNYDAVDGGSSTPPSPGQTPPPSGQDVWTTEVKNITETNAFVTARITRSSAVQFQWVGCNLFDSKGTMIAQAGEYPTSASTPYMDIWYDITADAWDPVSRGSISLKPGLEYKYQFYATYDGVDHFSPMYSFKTAGTHTHAYTSEITKNATCTESGTRTYTCTDCGNSYTESISATGHAWDEGTVTQPATCTEEGVITYVCSKCGEESASDIPAVGHMWDDGVVTKAATALEDGIITYTCGICDTTRTEVIRATGEAPEPPQGPDSPQESEPPQEPDVPQESEPPQGPDSPQESEPPQEPDVPQESEPPQGPDSPQEPETPEEPDSPQESETPQEPDVPQEPETPQTPETSGLPVGSLIGNVSGGNFKVTAAGKNVEFTGLAEPKATAVIPDVIETGGVTYKVTSVASGAFENNKGITKVTIGKNVQKIGSKAFSGCTKLKTVIFGAKVKTIGKKAFYKCKVLKKIVLPASVRTIGAQAFSKCAKVKNVEIKSYATVTGTIGKQAFSGIYKKVAVKIPKKNFAASKVILAMKGMPAKAVYRKL